MLVLNGPRALSKFRLKFLNRSVGAVQNGTRLDGASFFYLVNLSSVLDDVEAKRLDSLLQVSRDSNLKIEASGSNLTFVVPRRGTVSPWSSKATEIAKLCGFRKNSVL